VSCRRGHLILTVACLAGAAACSRTSSAGPERYAVLRFENLSADASADWMGRAFSEVVAAQLTGLPDLSLIPSARLHALDRAIGTQLVQAPGISAEREQALVAGATRLVYGTYTVRGGQMDVQLTVEDPASHKTVNTAALSGNSAGVLPLAAALARRIAPSARPYGTASETALRQYVAALESGTVPATAAALEQALADDPKFATPYLMLIQVRLAQQDRAGAEAVVQRALAQAGSMSALDRARLAAEAANFGGNVEERRKAMTELARANPSDAAVWRALGELSANQHKYPEAVQAYQQAHAAEPTSVEILNLLGYAAAAAGDLKAAMAALDKYRALRPAEANPLDSMGDVNYAAGRFQEAEQFFIQAHRKDPAFIGGGTLYKAAMARLMTGDLAGAEGLAKRYQDAHEAAKDPLLEFRRAEWLWMTGRRREGFARLSEFARRNETPELREIGSRSYSHLAMWSLARGDRAGAGPLAQKAAALAGQGSAAIAVMVRFLAQPPAPSLEWAVRAERAFPNPAQTAFKNFAVAYALLLDKHFATAAPLLKQMYESASPLADENLPVLLAWAYLEAGRTAEAVPLLAATPIPQPNGLSTFTVMSFPRIWYLRGLLAARQNRPDDARRAYQLFLKLSGPDPLGWGEEQRAQAGGK
jgi:tetratricopeptide (TPR) repeat protein